MNDTRIRRKREIDRRAQNALRERRRLYAESLELQLLATQYTASLNEERLLGEIQMLTARNHELARNLQNHVHGQGQRSDQTISGTHPYSLEDCPSSAFLALIIQFANLAAMIQWAQRPTSANRNSMLAD